MKIKTRANQLKEYNAKYSKREYDSIQSVEEYFAQRGWNLQRASKKAKQKLEKILEEREYETIHIIMYEYPMKTERPRTTRFGSIYSPNAADNHAYFEKAIRKVCEQIKLINTPAEIEIDAYLEMPSHIPQDEVILFEAKVLDILDMPDYDNIGKCYTDILKNVLITDDDIFHVGIIRKYYSVTPRVEIRITYLKSHESDFIYRKLKSRKSIKEGIASGQIVLHKLDYSKKEKKDEKNKSKGKVGSKRANTKDSEKI